MFKAKVLIGLLCSTLFPLIAIAATTWFTSDLAITMQDDPDPVTAGQSLMYHVTADNYGPNTANSVVLTVVLPKVASYLSGPEYCSYDTDTITCQIGVLPKGSKTFDLSVALDPAGNGYIASVGAIQSLNPYYTDPVPGNNNTNVSTYVIGPVLAISINDAETTEPETGSGEAEFKVTLSDASAFEVTVHYATTNDTAEAGFDYLETHGTLTFPPTSTEAFIHVPVLSDAITMEGHETFFVNLTNPTFAVISDSQGVGTISEPCLFCDHFDDNILRTDWTYSKPCWSENGHNLNGSPCASARTSAIAIPAFAGAGPCHVEAFMLTEGGQGNKLWLLAWYQDKKNGVEVIMREEADKWVVKQRAGGKVVAKTKASYKIDPKVKYEVKLYADETEIYFYVNNELLTKLPLGAPISGTVGFKVKNTIGRFDKIYVN